MNNLEARQLLEKHGFTPEELSDRASMLWWADYYERKDAREPVSQARLRIMDAIQVVVKG